LGKRDMVPNVNFFSKVTVGHEGQLYFRPGGSKPGNYVDLRFEMHVLVVLHTCQHPLDPEAAYHPRYVRLMAMATGPAPAQDACRERCPENGRGFRNTEMLYAS
jgi:uncharacterized protein YcgI (DUF1989 family)